METTNRSIFKRITCVLMVCLLCFTLMIPAFAASKTVTVNSSSKPKVVQIVTGKGFSYSLGWKKTTVTVKDTGKYPVAVYKNIGSVGYSYAGTLYAGQSKSFSASGSNKKYSIKLQKAGRGNTTVSVKTSAGSVY